MKKLFIISQIFLHSVVVNAVTKKNTQSTNKKIIKLNNRFDKPMEADNNLHDPVIVPNAVVVPAAPRPLPQSLIRVIAQNIEEEEVDEDNNDDVPRELEAHYIPRWGSQKTWVS